MVSYCAVISALSVANFFASPSVLSLLETVGFGTTLRKQGNKGLCWESKRDLFFLLWGRGAEHHSVVHVVVDPPKRPFGQV